MVRANARIMRPILVGKYVCHQGQWTSSYPLLQKIFDVILHGDKEFTAIRQYLDAKISLSETGQTSLTIVSHKLCAQIVTKLLFAH